MKLMVISYFFMLKNHNPSTSFMVKIPFLSLINSAASTAPSANPFLLCAVWMISISSIAEVIFYSMCSGSRINSFTDNRQSSSGFVLFLFTHIFFLCTCSRICSASVMAVPLGASFFWVWWISSISISYSV